jgi:hypothetical protein
MGRYCVICDCRLQQDGQFCYVHEPYARSSSRSVQALADQSAVGAVYAERAEQAERDEVRALDLRSDEQIARDEWAGGDGGRALLRRVLIARCKAGLPCDTELVALVDAYVSAVEAARAYLTSPPGTPYPAILGGDQ